MKKLIPALLAALFALSAQAAEQGILGDHGVVTVEGSVVTIPGSPGRIELGRDIAGVTGMRNADGTVVVTIRSLTPASGFLLSGLAPTQFSVSFMASGAHESMLLNPSQQSDGKYTFLPAAMDGKADGGTFTVTVLPAPKGR